MTSLNREPFTRDGYVVVEVLSPAEVAAFLAAAEALLARVGSPHRERMFGVNFLLEQSSDAVLQQIIHHPVLTRLVEEILGRPLILDNAKFLAADAGVSYRQGWHRDVLQIPEDQIDDAMFSPRWRHNSVQINLALTEDVAFWAVPGSHARPNTHEEVAVFGGSKHWSPEDAVMPGGSRVIVKPGQAALYNNNLIHRGTAELTAPRRTFHLGYHCALHPPTWHFYVFDDSAVTPAHLATLAPPVRKMIEERAARRRVFPDESTSYRAGLEGR